MRIAVGGIHTECSTYSPVLMAVDDFRVLRGADLLGAEYFNFLKADGVEHLPLLHARAVPGGPVSRVAYEAFKGEFLDLLKAALPVDGLYLAMHGAMNVEGMDDAEGDWISAARAVVGPDVIVAASYDLHGNVSQRIIDQLDIFAGYRTAPHIDVRETMVRAWSMLIEALKSGKRPGVAWAPVPVLWPGERTSTEDQPAKGLYDVLPAFDRRDGVLDANLMVGYVWADEPRATACAVITGSDKAAAAKAAEEIALSYWNAREEFRFGPVTGPLDDMLDIAEKADTLPVILADSADNPTGGGVGDRRDNRPPGRRSLLCRRQGRQNRIDHRRQPRSVEHAGQGRGGSAGACRCRHAGGASGGHQDRWHHRRPCCTTPTLSQHRRLHPAWPRSGIGAAAGREIRLSLTGTGADRQSEPDGADARRRQSGH
jgi:microcystin degradation protein MlrC